MLAPLGAVTPPPPLPNWLWIWLTTGNAPGYLAFIGAVVAASIAWRSSIASRHSADAARRQLARLQGLDRREQADQFAVWPIKVQCMNESMPKAIAPYRDDLHKINIGMSNTSGRPVYEVSTYATNDCIDESLGVLLGHWTVLPPAPSPARGQSKIILATSEPCVREMGRESHTVSVGVIFTDIYGSHWHRGPSGSLTALTSEQKRDLTGRLLIPPSHANVKVLDKPWLAQLYVSPLDGADMHLR